MNSGKSTKRALCIALTVLFLSSAAPSGSAVLYKIYSVHNVNGVDILGEPYTIRKNDYVLKLFKQKGVISQDFPEFLKTFSKINTSIKNIDRIHPGEAVIIPLKKISPGTFPGQESGVVKIPFITAGDIPQIVKNHSSKYTLKKGDYISRVVSREFGPVGSGSYRKGMELFKLANPNIRDLNRVRAGSEITLPKRELKSWYESLFEDKAADPKRTTVDEEQGEEPGEALSETTDTDYNTTIEGPSDPLAKAAEILGTTLYNRGACFFPGKGGHDVKLDLTLNPVMNFTGGYRVSFSTGKKLSKVERDTIRSSWKKIYFLPAPLTLEAILDTLATSAVGILHKEPLRAQSGALEIKVTPSWSLNPKKISGTDLTNLCIFSADTTDKIPPASLVQFLGSQNIKIKSLLFGEPWNPKGTSYNLKDKATHFTRVNTTDHHRFTREILAALDLRYDPRVTISFIYSGINIKASSSMISDGSGRDAIIDFGDLQGDSIFAIEKSGLKVISVDKNKPTVDMLPVILEKLHLKSSTDPTFTWSPGSKKTGISIKVPGTLVERNIGDKRLFTQASLPDGLMHYLFQKNIKVIQGSDL